MVQVCSLLMETLEARCFRIWNLLFRKVLCAYAVYSRGHVGSETIRTLESIDISATCR